MRWMRTALLTLVWLMLCRPESSASTLWYPTGTGFATWAFEDLWPAKGDYDFNDLVVKYRLMFDGVDDANVTTIAVVMKVEARGADQHSGFGINLPIPSETTATAMLWKGCNGASVTPEVEPDSVSFLILADAFDVLPSVAACEGFANTQPPDGDCATQPGQEFTLNISLSPGVARTSLLFGVNPFLFASDDPAAHRREVHLAGFPPTPRADQSLMGKQDDATVVTDLLTHPFYVTADNYPWGLDIPVEFVWPKEGVDVTTAYDEFNSWASSTGVDRVTWFTRTPEDGKGWGNTVTTERCDWCVARQVVCMPSDGCHLAGACVPETGVCSAGLPKADGEACEAGTCQNGVCIELSPADIPDLRFWLDANDSSTLYTDTSCAVHVSQSDDQVACWRDKSGHNDIVSQSLQSNRPMWKMQQLNQKSVVRFDGVSDYLNGGDILDMGTSERHIFIVAKTIGETGYLLTKASYSGAVARWAIGHDVTWGSLGLVYFTQDNLGYMCATLAVPHPSYEIVEGQTNRTSRVNSIYHNGSAALATGGLLNPSYHYDTSFSLLIGAYNNPGGSTPPQSGYFLNGDIAEILIYDRALSVPERQFVNAYLSQKYGIPL